MLSAAEVRNTCFSQGYDPLFCFFPEIWWLCCPSLPLSCISNLFPRGAGTKCLPNVTPSGSAHLSCRRSGSGISSLGTGVRVLLDSIPTHRSAFCRHVSRRLGSHHSVVSWESGSGSWKLGPLHDVVFAVLGPCPLRVSLGIGLPVSAGRSKTPAWVCIWVGIDLIPSPRNCECERTGEKGLCRKTSTMGVLLERGNSAQRHTSGGAVWRQESRALCRREREGGPEPQMPARCPLRFGLAAPGAWMAGFLRGLARFSLNLFLGRPCF